MKHPTIVFDDWARNGKDEGMEKSHNASVSEILDFALAKVCNRKDIFTFLDIGCGNGWVADRISRNKKCSFSLGIDGAEAMINNALNRETSAEYRLADLNFLGSSDSFDLIFSMEVLYYLDNPLNTIKKIYDILNPNGRFIMGIDHYFENENSHNWQEKVGTRMHLLKEEEWLSFFHKTNFEEIYSWRANSNDWAGTLVITGVK